MTILIIIVALVAVSWRLLDTYRYEDIGVLGIIVGGTGLVLCLITIPVTRMEVHARLAGIEALATTATLARADGDGLEGAAFRSDIADANAWLAAQQYWNGTVFDIWIPDEVDHMEAIR